MKYTAYQRTEIILSAGQIPINKLSPRIGKNPKAIYEWMRKHKIKVNRRLTEMELYIIQNFGAAQAKDFIPDKSINALRITECRLRKKTSK